MIKTWFKTEDKEFFLNATSKFSINLDSYLEDILTAEVENSGLVGGFRYYFCVGKVGRWAQRDNSQVFQFIRIDNHSLYTDGLILTPYSAEDVDYHLKGKTIDKRSNLERVELVGSDTDDFIMRSFQTYGNSKLIKNLTEKDKRLLLYQLN